MKFQWFTLFAPKKQLRRWVLQNAAFGWICFWACVFFMAETTIPLAQPQLPCHVHGQKLNSEFELERIDITTLRSFEGGTALGVVAPIHFIFITVTARRCYIMIISLTILEIRKNFTDPWPNGFKYFQSELLFSFGLLLEYVGMPCMKSILPQRSESILMPVPRSQWIHPWSTLPIGQAADNLSRRPSKDWEAKNSEFWFFDFGDCISNWWGDVLRFDEHVNIVSVITMTIGKEL